MIQEIIRKILNSLGDKDYQYAHGNLYFFIETLGNKASKDRKFLEKINFAGKTVYDIGAYIGLFTTFFAKKVGKEGKVIAFEPNPESFSELRINTARYPNVKTFCNGAGNKHEKLALVASADSRATSTVEQTMKLERTTHQHKEWSVEIVQIDELKNLPSPDFVKIDVEGFEYNVLEGMRNTIILYRPALFIEIHGVTNRMKEENVQKISAYLHNLNYELFSIENHRKITPSYTPLTGHVLAYFQGKQQAGQIELRSKP